MTEQDVRLNRLQGGSPTPSNEEDTNRGSVTSTPTLSPVRDEEDEMLSVDDDGHVQRELTYIEQCYEDGTFEQISDTETTVTGSVDSLTEGVSFASLSVSTRPETTQHQTPEFRVPQTPALRTK
jgi:hypothetical protein